MFELVIIVAVVTGLVEVAKKVGLPSKYAPLLAIVFGLGGGIYAATEVKEIVFYGLIIGLAASGLFDLAKLKKKKITL